VSYKYYVEGPLCSNKELVLEIGNSMVDPLIKRVYGCEDDNIDNQTVIQNADKNYKATIMLDDKNLEEMKQNALYEVTLKKNLDAIYNVQRQTHPQWWMVKSHSITWADYYDKMNLQYKDHSIVWEQVKVMAACSSYRTDNLDWETPEYINIIFREFDDQHIKWFVKKMKKKFIITSKLWCSVDGSILANARSQ